jgi:acylphosphatase
MQTTIYFVVSGRVQGVYFRAACKQVADQQAISGWVRNTPDGRVEGRATADADALQVLRDWLRSGPELACVDRLEIEEVPLQEFNGFEIREA